MTTKLVAKGSSQTDGSIHRYPVEVNVIVDENDRENSEMSVMQAGQTEASSMLERESTDVCTRMATINATKLSLDNVFLLNDLQNVCIKNDSPFISVEDNNSCETNDNAAEDQFEETQVLLPGQKTPEEDKKQTPSNTLNIFLNDLYNKHLDLNINFSNQEINDIQNAVKKAVNNIAETIGGIDTRLSIGEVISVGSAREGTQIIRPCEYDFILILDVLSNSRKVSITPANPDDNNREYMHIKLGDNEIRSLFHDITDDEYVRGSRSLPLFRKGLRQLLLSAIHQAVHSQSSVTMLTGNLTFKNTNVQTHGPAFTIGPVWKNHADKPNMEISVDLVPALRVYNILNHVLPSGYDTRSPHITCAHNVGSALLVPREGQRFKVTFTEAELLLTSLMSEHHKKCYKLLKYNINGEPFPFEASKTGLIKSLFGTRTGIHSYAIKITVWDHHYKQKCSEEKDLGSCICDMINKLRLSTGTRGIAHPFNKSGVIDPTYASIREVTYETETSRFNKIRLEKVSSIFKQICEIHTEEYNFTTCHQDIKPSESLNCNLPKSVLILTSLLLITSLKIITEGGNVLCVSVGFIFILFSMIYMFCVPRYCRRDLLAIESQRLTKLRIDTLIVFGYAFVYIIGCIFYSFSMSGYKYGPTHFIVSYCLAVICFSSILFMCANIPTFQKCFSKHQVCLSYALVVFMVLLSILLVAAWID